MTSFIDEAPGRSISVKAAFKAWDWVAIQLQPSNHIILTKTYFDGDSIDNRASAKRKVSFSIYIQTLQLTLSDDTLIRESAFA